MRITPNDPRLPRCGFARLVGEGGIDFVLRKYECTMGRRSKAATQDVVLGDVMSISRQHADIKYNFEKSKLTAQLPAPCAWGCTLFCLPQALPGLCRGSLSRELSYDPTERESWNNKRMMLCQKMSRKIVT